MEQLSVESQEKMPNFELTQVTDKETRLDFDHLWQKTWLDQGYAKPENIREIAQHYTEYNQYSVDYILKSDNQPAGTIRLILDSELGLPVLNDFELNEAGKKIVAGSQQKMESTLLTLSREFQDNGHNAALHLMRAFYQYCAKNNLPGAFMAADRRLKLLLQRLGFVLEQIGPEKMYEGSLTFPLYIDLEKSKELLPKKNKELYDFFHLPAN